MNMAPGIQHLLVVTPGFAADENDTPSIPPVQQFIRSFQNVYPGIKISILSFHYPYKKAHYLWHGADVYSIGNKHAGGLKKALNFSRAMSVGKRIHKQKHVDAILCLWLTDTALIGKLLAKKMGAPYMIWMHGQDAKPGNKYVAIVNPSMKQLAAISYPQQQLFFTSYGQEPGYVISNGINANIFPELNMGSREIDLLAAGSFIPLKQYHLFIEVVYLLKNNGYPGITAVLVGNGELEGELKKLIVKLGLESNIVCTGRLLHHEVLDAMNNTKVFVHPSQYEGQSTVMLEALYSGCTVVSFLPVGTDNPVQLVQSADVQDIARNCMNALNSKPCAQRVLVSDMNNSATQVKHILDDLFNHQV